MLAAGAAPFFTPLYECTPIRIQLPEFPCNEEQERRVIGSVASTPSCTRLSGKKIVCKERGDVFTILELKGSDPTGTIHWQCIPQAVEAVPRIDFRMELGKTISTDGSMSVFRPREASPGREPVPVSEEGARSLPSRCGSGVRHLAWRYYMSDDGLAFVGEAGSVLVASRDVPLVYMGEMRHHPILLCDNKEENNQRRCIPG